MSGYASEPAELAPDSLTIPRSVADTGVRRNVLEDIAIKVLYLAGNISIMDLAERMRLSFQVANELFERLKKEQLCDVTGVVGYNNYQFGISSRGRTRALELLTVSQYAGPAPVTLASYVQQARAQTIRNFEVHPPDLKRAFASLVLDDDTLHKLGTALNSGTSIFLYGPTGMGKTSIAEKFSKVFAQDHVWIPFAVEVDGQIITVYDPGIHREVKDPESPDRDLRWVRCERPTVLVGGELTIEMLDLQFNPSLKYYSGPLQMKANDGVLIIDDFGRQRLRPEELLNRWVVPLDRRIDFLTLTGGQKIEVPFELVVVFATNLNPAELVDAAFLRRIQTKIKVEAVSGPQFREIFRRVCTDAGLAYDVGIVEELIGVIRDKLQEPLRPCYPGDIVRQICWAARYEGKTPCMDRVSVLQAVDTYFLPTAEGMERRQRAHPPVS